MGILIALMPWFLFWFFVGFKKYGIAALAGFLAIIVVMLREKIRGRSIKILQIGTFVFFLLFAASILVFGKCIIARHVNLLGNSAIMLTVLFSIIMRRPFTIQFTRERTSKDIWNNPEFIQLNYAITWFWFFVLLVNFALTFVKNYGVLDIPRWLNVFLHIFNCLVAVKVTLWYAHKKRMF